MIKIHSSHFLPKDRIFSIAKKGASHTLSQCAMLIEDQAKRLLRQGGVRKIGRRTVHIPSPPGTPPHVQTGTLRSSIAWAWADDKKSKVLVGPQAPPAAYGAVHEFGGRHHPPRPFMRPAFDLVRPYIPERFQGCLNREAKVDVEALNRAVDAWVKRWRGKYGKRV